MMMMARRRRRPSWQLQNVLHPFVCLFAFSMPNAKEWSGWARVVRGMSCCGFIAFQKLKLCLLSAARRTPPTAFWLSGKQSCNKTALEVAFVASCSQKPRHCCRKMGWVSSNGFISSSWAWSINKLCLYLHHE